MRNLIALIGILISTYCLANSVNKTEVIYSRTGITGNFTSDPILIDRYKGYSAHVFYTVSAATTGVFTSGVQATKTVQGMLYTAKKSATGLDGSGNLISVGYQTGATVGSEWATVVGNAITVYIQDGTTTDTQIKNAVYANNFSSSLVTLTGFTTVAQTSQVATFLSGGVNSQIFYTSGIVTKANHGYTSGRLGQLTTTTTLPAGLSTGTDYYIVKVTDNTFGFATSYATAFSTSGIVNVTADTAGVHTFTPTAASATAKIQYSNDGNTWLDIASMSGSTNSTGSVIYNQADAYWAYIRFMHTVAAGQANVSCVLTRKE